MRRAVALLLFTVLAAGCGLGDAARLADTVRAAVAPAPAASERTVAPEDAVRAAIERANAAQAEAFASGDPEPMRATSTTAHYAELAATNRSLARSGATAIALVRIEFEDVRVDGDAARATTYETWRTEYADGALNEQTDRNDYTLVRTPSGWRITANEQPAAGAAAPARPRSDAPATSGTSRATLPPVTNASRSSNWSGYSATGGTFTSVTGTWIVPVTASSPAGVDAAWVGIGGVDTEDLVQAGTMATVTSSGAVSYEAWIEMLPAASRTVPLAVSGGDSVTVTITERSSDRWHLALKNNTSGGRYEITVDYVSSRSSAEWVEEAPSSARGLLPLSDFGTIRFAGASAVRDGQTLTPARLGARPIAMYNGLGQALAIPSQLAGTGDAFEVTRTAAQSTAGTPGTRRRR